MRAEIVIVGIIVGVGAVLTSANAASHFTVGPDEPHKTISSALSSMLDGGTCVISAGVYRERIEVQQNNVALIGKGRVVITGCDEMGKMRPCAINGRSGLKTVIDGPVYDVFCGERYLMPARYPNKTVEMTSNEDWESSNIGPQGNVSLGKDLHKRFPNLKDGYYLGLHGRVGSSRLSSWKSIRLPITGLTTSGYMQVDRARASSGYMGKYGKGKGLGYIIGARAVLDAPGEWYADGKELILIPPAGDDAAYEARTRLYGAVITGDNVRLENIRFKAATARIDGSDVQLRRCSFEYISPFQPNPHRKLSRFDGATGQSLVSCWGSPDNGTAGVYVQGDGFIAENCRFSKSWWCGMTVRGDRARIDNCLFEDANWMASRAAGLFCWGDGSVVRHCSLRNLGGAGIEGGNAAWVEQYAMNNIWEYNYVEDISKLIVDQGFFYVNHQSGSRPAANSIWRYNVGAKATGPKKGSWTKAVAAYYVDNSSSGYHIHNNIAVDVLSPMKHNDTQDGDRASKDVWYFNNTFYRCGAAEFGSFGNSKKRDADLNVVNNLAVACSKGALSDARRTRHHENNTSVRDVSVLKDVRRMDFTPVTDELTAGGVPVLGRRIPYVGAVDPKKGMWRYGADVSKLPRHSPDPQSVRRR
jgi:hypothetical protein